MKATRPSTSMRKSEKCVRLFTEAIYLQKTGMEEMALQICQQILSIDPRFVDAYTMKGILLAGQGKNAEAIDQFKRVIAIHPENLAVHCNIGLALMNQSLFSEAEAEFRKILSKSESYVPALNALGVIMIHKGKHAEAIHFFRLSLGYEPSQPDTLNNLGNCHLEIGEVDESESNYRKSIELSPHHVDALFNHAKLCAQSGRSREAEQRYRELLDHAPGFAPALINLSKMLIDEAKAAEAVHFLRRGLGHHDKHPELWYVLGVALKEQGDHALAVEAFTKVIDLDPSDLAAFVNRGSSLRELNRFDWAVADLERAKDAKEPETLAALWAAYATLYEDAGEEGKVEDAYLKAIQFNPEDAYSKMNYGIWLLKMQRFKDAWPYYQSRYKIKTAMYVSWLENVPIWAGGELQGRTLLVAEQGVGDQVFHSKYLKMYLEKYDKPAGVMVDQRLLSAYQRAFPDVRFFAQSRSSELNPSEFDIQIGMGDLAALLSLNPIENPLLQKRTLSPDPSRPAVLSQRRGRPVIGLSWKSTNAKSSADKSMRLLDIMMSLKNVDADWVNLQYGDVEADIASVKNELGIEIRRAHEVDVFDDLEGLIQLIHECDLVISGSNSTAHFAGALGKPGLVWVPFNKGKLWYWHMDDGPSVWYPSLHVVHCKAHGDWSYPLSVAEDHVKKQLDGRIA